MEVDNETQFELDEYNSEDENASTKSTMFAPLTQGLSATSLQLMDKLVTKSVRESPAARLIDSVGWA